MRPRSVRIYKAHACALAAFALLSCLGFLLFNFASSSWGILIELAMLLSAFWAVCFPFFACIAIPFFLVNIFLHARFTLKQGRFLKPFLSWQSVKRYATGNRARIWAYLFHSFYVSTALLLITCAALALFLQLRRADSFAVFFAAPLMISLLCVGSVWIIAFVVIAKRYLLKAALFAAFALFSLFLGVLSMSHCG